MNRNEQAAPAASKRISVIGYILVLFGLFVLVGSFILWGEGLIIDPPAGIDLAFPVADILVNAPASIAAGIGLIKHKRWGMMLSWFVAGLYIYASVEIFVHVSQLGGTFPPEIVVPQVLAVIVACLIMSDTWRNQYLFE